MAKSSATRLVHVTRTSPTNGQNPRKLPKTSVLYAHYSGESYDCDDCAFWLTDKRCIVHRSDLTVNEDDKCGFMIQGKPDTFWGKPHLNLDPKQTGFVRGWGGEGCRVCVYYNTSRDCEKVDKNSPGDDPGEINPMACCALQKKVGKG